MRRRAALPALLLVLLLPAQAAALCCLPHLTRTKGAALHHGAAAPMEASHQSAAPAAVQLVSAETCGVLATPAPALRSRPESTAPELAVPPDSALTIAPPCERWGLTIAAFSSRTSPLRQFSPLRL